MQVQADDRTSRMSAHLSPVDTAGSELCFLWREVECSAWPDRSPAWPPGFAITAAGPAVLGGRDLDGCAHCAYDVADEQPQQPGL